MPMALAAAQLLLLSSLLYVLSSSGTAAAQQLPGTITVPSTNPALVYPPAITVPAAVLPPPPPLIFSLPPPPLIYSLPPPGLAAQSWCVARPGAPEAAVQAALDYACGGGAADCAAIQPAGSCFIPNTLRDHASYAFNSYYQRNPSPASCNFGGAAILININPSTTTCTYPSTSSQASPLTTYTPTVSTPSPPAVYGYLPGPTISNPSQPTVSNPAGAGAVFGQNPPGYTASSSSTSASTAPAGRRLALLSHLILLIGSLLISRWQF